MGEGEESNYNIIQIYIMSILWEVRCRRGVDGHLVESSKTFVDAVMTVSDVDHAEEDDRLQSARSSGEQIGDHFSFRFVGLFGIGLEELKKGWAGMKIGGIKIN